MKKTLLFILLLIFTFLPLSSFSSNTASNSDTIEYWNNVLINRQKKLSHLRKEIPIFNALIDKKSSNLNESKEFTEVKFQQLKFTLLTNLNSPYVFRLIVKELSHLLIQFENDLNANKTIQSSLNQHINILRAAKETLNILEQNKISSKLRESISEMKKSFSYINDRLIAQKDKLDKTIADAVDLDNSINKEKNEFDDFIWMQMKFYFLTPRDSLFSADTWFLFNYHFNEWSSIALTTLTEKIPDSPSEWLYLFLFLICGTPIYLIGKFLFSKKFDIKKHKLLYSSWFWFVLAGTLIAYNYYAMHFPETLVAYVIAIICLIRGIMNLSWALKSRQKIEDNLSHPLEPLFWLYVFGIILQTLNIASVMLTCLWIAGEFVTLVFMYKKTKLPYPIFEKSIIILSIILCFISIIITSVGFVFLSILGALAWFLLVIGLKFGININIAFKEIVDSFNKEKYILSKLFILGFGIPLIWCIIIFFIFFWLSNQLIETSILLNSLDTEVSLWGFSINIFYLIFGIYLFFVFKTIINVVKASLSSLSAQANIDSSAIPSVTLLVSYAAWTIYSLILLKLFGVSFTSLAVVTGGLGIGIGIGLREIINNFASGLIILAGRTLKHGDIIQMDQLWGKVIKITIRSTIIQTFDNAILSIPNSQIISNKLINWTHNNSLVRKDISINIAYNSDIEKVNALLVQLAKDTDHVLNKPEPIVLFNDFGDSTLNFVLRIWIDNIDYIAKIPSSLRTEINKIFRENGIKFAYPQLDIHIDNNKIQDL